MLKYRYIRQKYLCFKNIDVFCPSLFRSERSDRHERGPPTGYRRANRKAEDDANRSNGRTAGYT